VGSGFHGIVRSGNNGYVQARTWLSTVDGKVLAENDGVFVSFSGLPVPGLSGGRQRGGAGRVGRGGRGQERRGAGVGGRRCHLAERAGGGCRGTPEGARAAAGRVEFVSLNVKAVDAAGNSVEQKTIRAYGVNRPLG